MLMKKMQEAGRVELDTHCGVKEISLGWGMLGSTQTEVTLVTF